MQKTEFANADLGTILLIREGVLIGNFANTRLTDADYGNGLKAAFAAAQAGDTIITRGVTMSGKDFYLEQDNVRWINQDTKINPETGYTSIVEIRGDNCEVSGLTVDGEGTANVGSGYGLVIKGEKCQVKNCEVSGTRGTGVADGSALYITNGYDCLVDGFISRDAGYAAISGNDADRLTVRNAQIINPVDRGLNIAGDQDLDYVTLENITGLCDTGTGLTVGCGLNWNSDGIIGVVTMRNVNLTNGDIVSPGNSYNSASFLHMMKVQSIKTLIMDSCTFLHGDNAGAGAAPSWRFESPGLNPPPVETHVSNCWFSDGVSFNGAVPPYLRFTGTTFGGSQCSSSRLLYTFLSEDFAAADCLFNIYDKSGVFSISASRSATDLFRLENNRFVCNQATSPYVATSEIAISACNNICANNRFINEGAGGWTKSNDLDANLSLTTDRNGDMNFDDSDIYNAGTNPTGVMPDPGGGPTYFPTLPANTNGRKIWNINWSPDASQVVPEKGWIAHNGVWKEIT